MRGSSLSVMAWRNLWRNRRRTLLTLSSIVFGVFLAVIFTAMQDRNWADMIDLAARLGGGHVTLQHPEYLDVPTLTRTTENTHQLTRLALRQPHVRRVVERITGYNMLTTAGESYGAGFIAFDPQAEDETTLSVMEGLVEGEIFRSSRDPGIVLGERLAKNLGVGMGGKVIYTMTDKEGEIVGSLARVSGLVRTGAPTVDGGLCLLPIDTVRQVLGYAPDEAIQVAAFLDDERRTDAVVEGLRQSLAEARPAAGGRVTAALPWYETQPQLAGFIALKVGGARVMEILIAVLVAAGIFNTLFVSVMERMQEFGVMIAIGFSPGKLFRLVLLESLWLGLVGLLLAALVTLGPYLYLASTGIDVSAMLSEGDTEVAGVALSTTLKVGIYPESAVIIALAALLAVLLAGVYPAWRAGRADPVESLKLG